MQKAKILFIQISIIALIAKLQGRYILVKINKDDEIGKYILICVVLTGL